MKNKISEKRIVDVLVAYMSKTHTVGTEIRHYEKRIDLVAIDTDGDQIITVEAKLENWKKAIGQAIVNLVAGQKAYVGMYSKNAHRVDIKLLDEYGIGLISIGSKWGEVEFLHEAQPSKYYNPLAGDRVKSLVFKPKK